MAMVAVEGRKDVVVEVMEWRKESEGGVGGDAGGVQIGCSAMDEKIIGVKIRGG